MSDYSQGPGWWQASDGKWYPPEQQPAAPTPPPGGGARVDIGAALGYGWNKFVQYIGPIIAIVLIIVAINIGFNFIGGFVSEAAGGLFGSLLNLLFTIAGIFLSFLLTAGLIRAALAVTQGQAPDPAMLFRTDNLAPFALASVLVSLMILVGFLALCVGALVVWFFTFFYGFYVIDRGVSPVDSISSSFNLVKDNLGSVAGFLIVTVLLNVITCGLASGVTYIAGAYVYKTLNGEAVAA
jgi:uncharacterized membrane protein